MTDTIATAPIALTAGAIAEIKRLQTLPTHEADTLLRIGVNGGGCAGMTYVLGFDKADEKDTHYDVEGITVIVNRAHAMYLIGMEVDHQNGLNARGFTFNNPNATSTCGCGTSFAV